jgi:Flp pilus assembly CpaF family ATPase
MDDRRTQQFFGLTFALLLAKINSQGALLTIHLTPEQEQSVKDLLESGHFESIEQVIAEALKALRQEGAIGCE